MYVILHCHSSGKNSSLNNHVPQLPCTVLLVQYAFTVISQYLTQSPERLLHVQGTPVTE